MNIKEAASYLRLNYMTVYKLAQKHCIPAFKVGGNWRFKKNILNNWLNAQANTNMSSILIVDHDPKTRESLREIIHEQRHAVTVAESTEFAVEEVKKQHFDVIFLDLSLPGTDGKQLLTAIKEKARDATIVIITTQADETTALKAVSTGPLLMIRKPFREKDVIDVLNIVIKPKAE